MLLKTSRFTVKYSDIQAVHKNDHCYENIAEYSLNILLYEKRYLSVDYSSEERRDEAYNTVVKAMEQQSEL